MKISKTKFVFLFVVCALVFTFATRILLNQLPQSLFGSESQSGWQSVASIILSPLRIVLIGPPLPVMNFLQQDPDPPPPFFIIGLVFYWIMLALAIYYVIGKINKTSELR